MEIELSIRPLLPQDIHCLSLEFQAIGWQKPESVFATYLREQAVGKRQALVALLGSNIAGYTTVTWVSAYPPFARGAIPEICDLNVLPRYQRVGIGSTLLDAAERVAGSRAGQVGVGVGLYAGYGSAQRLYVRRGYVPDGRGLTYRYRVLPALAITRNDDDLLLFLSKKIS